MKTSVKSEILLETSCSLFEQYGYKATGVDLIIKESNVSKATLYKYFKTKEQLILAVLKQRNKIGNAEKEQSIAKLAGTKEPILGIFDFYHERFQRPNYPGCPILRAATEFNDEDSIINKFTTEVELNSKKLLIKHLITPTRSESEAEELANSLLILIHGAIMNAKVCQNKNAALEAKKVASSLLQ